MRRTAALLVFSAIYLATTHAQVVVTLTVRSPLPSQISAWQRDPTLIQVTILNTTATSYANARVSFTVRELDKNIMVAKSEDEDPAMPRFTIPARSTAVRNGPQLVNADAVTIDEGTRKLVTTTNSIPEGNYEFCVTVLAESGTALNPSPVCQAFIVVIPDPPTLLSPADGDSLKAGSIPTFTWTPVFTAPGIQASYRLTLAPMFTGQTAKNALLQNSPLFDQQVPTSTYFYSPANPQFSLYPDAIGFVWQVQALDAQGQPATRNNGRSEVSQFAFAPGTVSAASLILQSPANNAELATTSPQFSWLPLTGGPKNVTYRLHVVPLQQGQNVRQAMNTNTRVYNPQTATGVTSVQPQTPLSLQTTTKYAWFVEAIDPSTNAVVATSTPNAFSYKSPSVGGPGGYSIAGNTVVTGNLMYEFSDVGEYTGWPLVGIPVKIVVEYVLKNPVRYTQAGKTQVAGSVVVPSAYLTNPKYKDDGKVLAVTTTGGGGAFSFLFWAKDSVGVMAKDLVVGTITGEFPNGYKGELHRVYRLQVENAYYTSPDNDILAKALTTTNLGNIFAGVRGYGLRVRLMPDKNVKGAVTYDAVPGHTVYLLRSNRPLNVPANEGLQKPTSPMKMFNAEVVAIDTSAATGANKGTVTFKRLVKNIGPNDKYYLLAVQTNPDAPLNYFSAGFLVPYSFAHETDKAVYASEYVHNILNVDLTMKPQPPSIAVNVRDDNGKSIAGAPIELLNYAVFFVTKEAEHPSSDAGSYTFTNLAVNVDANGKVTGPIRAVRVKGKSIGYTDDKKMVPATSAPLRYGERAVVDFTLPRGALVRGKVVTAGSGEGIFSDVAVGDNPTVQAKSVAMIFPSMKWGPAGFSTRARRLPAAQAVIVTPGDPRYFPDTSYHVINKDTVDLGTIAVTRRTHKILVQVRELQPGKKLVTSISPPVQNAVVKIKGLPGEWLTDANGKVLVEFENDATTFDMIFSAPKGKYYVKKILPVANQPTKASVLLTVGLEKATFIAGTVYLTIGGSKKPVDNALVYVKQGSPGLDILTTSGSDGTYLLANVPIGSTVPVWGAKPSQDTTIVGDSVVVKTTAAGTTGADLELTVYAGMDITKLLGFPLALESLTELAGGKLSISGRITAIPSNAQFEPPSDPSTPWSLSFGAITVEQSGSLNANGIPTCVPSSLPVSFDEKSLPAKLYATYLTEIGDATAGPQLRKADQTVGAIYGKPRVSSLAYSTGSALGSFDGYYLALPGVSNSPAQFDIAAFRADGKEGSSAPNGFRVTDASGGGLSLTLNGFGATADPAASFVLKDTLRLRTVLKTDIEGTTPKDLAIDIGDVKVVPAGVVPLSGTNPISLSLDTWTLEGTQWYFTYLSIGITKGVLKTPSLSVPITKVTVKPTELIETSFDLQKLSIGGILPLVVTKPPALGYDKAKSEWYLFASKGADASCAHLENLPGLAAGDKILFESLRITSKGTQDLSPAATPVPIYTIGKLTAGKPVVLPDAVQIPGLTFSIPQAGVVSTSIFYGKSSTPVPTFSVLSVPVVFESNGVVAQFGKNGTDPSTEKFDAKGFVVRGTVSEAGKFSFVSWLYHSKDSTSIWVETTPKQSLAIGAPKTSLIEISGSMRVQKSEWSLFSFEGDLHGTPGVAGRLQFTVYGDIVANNQKISVTNVPTPFGNLAVTYDIEKKRLFGSLHVPAKEISSIASVSGDLAFGVDGNGWYLLGAGTLSLKNPHFDIKAALVFADYSSISSVQEFKDIFLTHAEDYLYQGKMPDAFTGSLTGFFFTGLVKLPIPFLPSFDVNLDPVVHCYLDPYFGGNIQFGANFSGPNTYYVRATVFLGVKAGAGGTVGLACMGASFKGEVYVTAPGVISGSSWYVEGKAGLILAGSAYVGGGCCDSDCDCLISSDITGCICGGCAKDEWGDDINYGLIRVRIGSEGIEFGLLE